MFTRYMLLLFIIKTYCFTETQSQALPGCQERCGNVTIPYPFGIGQRCSAHDTYSITCNASFNPPRPFITSINFEVLEISIQGKVRVISPLFNSCKASKKYTVINFTNTPFTYSPTANRFTGMGCDNIALISGPSGGQAGCLAFCNVSVGNNICLGGYCCQTNIPPSLKIINASVGGIQNVDEECKYAFMVDVDWFGNLTSIFDLPSMSSVHAILDWSLLRDCNGFEDSNSSNTSVCGSNSFCLASSDQTVCTCSQGYQGNPYLPGGCQDIDECASNSTNTCVFTCINLPGGYNCSCPDGYFGHGNACVKLQNNNNRMKTILIGCFSGLGGLLLLFVVWWVYKIIKKRKKDMKRRVFFKRNGGLLLQQQMSSGDDGNVEKTKIFTSKELEKATDHFNENRILGQGGQGTVYKGMLSDGNIVAVKMSKIKNTSEIEQFINEVVILSQINHRNVVKLHGCCLETEVPLLVYEFIPNGTLYDYIHDQNQYFPLTWEVRLRIATEIGGALSYLHSSAGKPIYHRDIKSTNILLDDKFRAKVADFGTSRTLTVDQTHLTTKVQGTFGYLDPEYFQSSQFTEKSDVYSFGVVLVELLTGEKPIVSFRVGETRSLATYFMSAIEENRLSKIVDPLVKMEGKEDQIRRFADLANKCLNLDGRKRPRMKQVGIELELIRTSSEEPTTEEVEYNNIIEDARVWDAMSTGIESGPISISSSNDFHPLLL